MARNRQPIDRKEFAGNYTHLYREEFLAILAAYRKRTLTKTDLRVFAASLEFKALHPKSVVDLQRITNARRASGPRLRSGEILESLGRLDKILFGHQQGPKMIVARRMAKVIAQGATTRSETIVLLYYCYRRKKQKKRLRSLAPRERYARFRYGELAKLSGCARATLCRAVARLRRRGLLEVIQVHKQNENTYGNLFIDGQAVSLTPQHRHGAEACRKPTTPVPDSDLTPRRKATTLTNRNPKRRILNRKNGFSVGLGLDVFEPLLQKPPRTKDPEMQRIFHRAKGMLAQQLDAVA